MGRAYSYRSFMLDPARHFLPLEEVLKLIKAASMLGLNRFHWHLTDDQGWRIEIRRYPRLTEVGSVRGESCFWGENPTENNCGFYSQQDIRRAVEWARECEVEIVPEIEVPGHASAMLAAYPQYGCWRENSKDPRQYQVQTRPGVFPALLCAGREDSVAFLENILDEICRLFPGPYVHIGGDEAVKQHWRRCPDCQRRMRENGLKNENELQRWLVLRVGEFLKQRGKRTIVWNESLAGGPLPHHFVVQHWLGNDKETAAFLREGGEVICSDADRYYINRPYHMLDARAVYETPEIPSYAKGHEDGLIGFECPLWGERITNARRAQERLFPRLAIAAMRARGEDKPESWEACKEWLRREKARLSDLDLYWAEEKYWAMSPEDVEQGKKDEDAKRHLPGMDEVFDVNWGIIRQDMLEALLSLIGMPRPFALQTANISWSALGRYADCEPADDTNGAKELNEQLLRALSNRLSGAWANKPEDVWLDTMRCFTRFVNEHWRQCGQYGFDRGFWTVRQVEGRLFRLGELEYERLEDGDQKTLAMHIPSDAILEPEKLNASVEKARAFMKEFYPEWAGAPITLHSWLLSHELASLLPEDSRILRFQRAFAPTEEQEDCLAAVLQWVYALPPQERSRESLSSLPEDTSLRRSMKAFLLSGGRIYAAKGTLARKFGI